MNYMLRVIDKAFSGARHNYRYYVHWRRQEDIARTYSPDRLKALQWSKFIRLLEFAYNRIPFYRDKFRQAGVTPACIRTREDILRIPVLTKDEIRQNFPDRIVDGRRKYPPSMIGNTSGSTGESLHFVKPDESWKYSLDYSTLLRMRTRGNVPVLVFSTPRCTPSSCSMEDSRGVQDPPVGTFQRIRLFRRLDIEPIGVPPSENILGAPDEYMERVGRIVAFFSPCIMIVDPVYFGAFARYAKRHMQPIPELAAIITTYELLTPSLEDLFRETFGCSVYTQYGASEMTDVAYECECHRLHVRASNVLVEALRDGRPARPGETGRAILTSLNNYNMPFIRYDIGDVLTKREGPCPCGRNTETLERVHGRTCDLVRRDGGRAALTPLEVDSIFRGLPGIAAYRLIQRTEKRYHVTIMPDGTSELPDRQALVSRGRSLLGDDSQFEFELTPQIEPERSMKFRFVYSELPGVSL